jgi:hypothetical protein
MVAVVAVAATIGGCDYLKEKAKQAEEADKVAGKLDGRSSGGAHPVEKVPGPGIAAGKRYRIQRLRVEIERKDWDDSSAPDPKVVLMANGAEVGVCKLQDSFVVTCNPKADFELEAGTEITINVVDRDVAFDDKIGTASLSGLTGAGMLDADLPMRTRGGVKTARVRIIRAPTFFEDQKFRLYGLVGGVVGAIFIALLFGRYLFDERHYLVGAVTGDEPGDDTVSNAAGNAVAQVIKVRCPFCSGLCAETATTCEHCGGKL